MCPAGKKRPRSKRLSTKVPAGPSFLGLGLSEGPGYLLYTWTQQLELALSRFLLCTRLTHSSVSLQLASCLPGQSRPPTKRGPRPGW